MSTFNEKMTKSIEAAAKAEAATAYIFETLRDFAVAANFASKQDYLDALVPSEEEFALNWAEEEAAEQGCTIGEIVEKSQTKSGKWKMRTILPNAWSSAKSVVGTAIDKGIDIEGMGKSELQKAIKDSGGARGASATPAERAMSYVTKLKNVWGDLTEEEQANIRSALGDL